MANDNDNQAGAVQRRPRNKGIMKDVKKGFKSLYNYSIPAFRYMIVPALLYVSVNYTEPAPTLSELLNPFY